MPYPRTILTAALAFILLGSRGHSQDAGRVVTLSPVVGAVIDSTERERYVVFPRVERFHSARFLILPDSTFRVQFRLRTPDGSLADSSTEYSRTTVFMIAEKIHNFARISEGSYVWGSSPPRLLIEGGDSIGTSRVEPSAWAGWYIAPRPEELLPFETPAGVGSLEPFPRIFFRAALSSYSPSLQGIAQALDDISAKYASLGFPVPSQDPDIALGPMWSLSLGVRTSSSLAFSLETASATSVDDNMEIESVSVGAEGYLPLTDEGTLQLFGSIAATFSRMSYEESFPYKTRITPVDTSGAYYYLESVSVKGGWSGWGVCVASGIELQPSVPLALRASVGYLLAPSFEIRAPAGTAGTASLRGLLLGAALVLLF